MKLISMTDFIFEQSKLNGYDLNDSDWIERVINYAKLLKQTLKLEMFVPCDDDGNVLDFEDDNYEKAKENVFFEGFCEDIKYNYDGEVRWVDSEKHRIHFNLYENVEKLILEGYELTLTPSAIKQFM